MQRFDWLAQGSDEQSWEAAVSVSYNHDTLRVIFIGILLYMHGYANGKIGTYFGSTWRKKKERTV